MKYCNINDGQVIDIDNTSNITIEYCNITNSSSYGLYLGGASNVLIQYNTIANSNVYDGIDAVGGTNNNCYWNTIYKYAGSNGWQRGIGIVYSACSGTIGENDVDNYAWGISSMYGGSIYADEYPATKNNRIDDCPEGLMVYNSAFCQFGQKPSPSVYGLNSIDNCSQYFNVYNSSTIYAIGDYWGSYPPDPSKFEVGSGGTAYYSSYELSYDPWGTTSVPSGTKEVFGPGATIASSTVPASDQVAGTQSPGIIFNAAQDSLLAGIDLRQKGGLVAAMNYFMSYLKSHPGDPLGYVQLYGCTNDTTLPSIFIFFKELPSKASPIEKLLLSNLYQMENDPALAMAVDDSIIANYPSNPIAVRAELSNMLIDLLDNHDISGAEGILQRIKGQAQLINPIELMDDEAMFGVNQFGVPSKPMSKSAMSAVKPNLPKTFELLQNYPNPFNPTTMISYTIPKDGHVMLKIYDVLGREVETLVDESQKVGRYEIQFNGSHLASGVYFYRLISGGHVFTKKLMLIK